MKTYAEYFIGGPLDGKDRVTDFPYTRSWDVVMKDDEHGNRWIYRPCVRRMGVETVTYWADTRMLSREILHMRLYEIILAPHRVRVDLTKKGGQS